MQFVICKSLVGESIQRTSIPLFLRRQLLVAPFLFIHRRHALRVLRIATLVVQLQHDPQERCRSRERNIDDVAFPEVCGRGPRFVSGEKRDRKEDAYSGYRTPDRSSVKDTTMLVYKCLCASKTSRIPVTPKLAAQHQPSVRPFIIAEAETTHFRICSRIQ